MFNMVFFITIISLLVQRYIAQRHNSAEQHPRHYGKARGKRYLVPTGSTELHLGDRLFIVAESKDGIDKL